MSAFDPLAVRSYLLDLQKNYCDLFAKEDGCKEFGVDHWKREVGGEGYTRVLTEGALIEQGAVNFSHVFGDTLPQAASQKNPDLTGARFEAMGVSVIIHPKNPYIPTTHANLRFLTARKSTGERVWWFGGGFDLTPFYPFKEDCVYWHQMALQACAPFGKDVYPDFKTAADEYFYLKHRQECRGIGGLFLNF